MLWSEPFSRMLNSTMREGTTKKIQISEDPAIVKMVHFNTIFRFNLLFVVY